MSQGVRQLTREALEPGSVRDNRDDNIQPNEVKMLLSVYRYLILFFDKKDMPSLGTLAE